MAPTHINLNAPSLDYDSRNVTTIWLASLWPGIVSQGHGSGVTRGQRCAGRQRGSAEWPCRVGHDLWRRSLRGEGWRGVRAVVFCLVLQGRVWPEWPCEMLRMWKRMDTRGSICRPHTAPGPHRTISSPLFKCNWKIFFSLLTRVPQCQDERCYDGLAGSFHCLFWMTIFKKLYESVYSHATGMA